MTTPILPAQAIRVDINSLPMQEVIRGVQQGHTFYHLARRPWRANQIRSDFAMSFREHPELRVRRVGRYVIFEPARVLPRSSALEDVLERIEIEMGRDMPRTRSNGILSGFSRFLTEYNMYMEEPPESDEPDETSLEGDSTDNDEFVRQLRERDRRYRQRRAREFGTSRYTISLAEQEWVNRLRDTSTTDWNSVFNTIYTGTGTSDE